MGPTPLEPLIFAQKDKLWQNDAIALAVVGLVMALLLKLFLVWVNKGNMEGSSNIIDIEELEAEDETKAEIEAQVTQNADAIE